MLANGPVRLPPEQWAALAAAYSVPERAYHNIEHVREVVGHYGVVAAGEGWLQPAEVYLAVLYHDAIYRPGARDNEALSAELATRHIARWLPGAGVDLARVGGLIRLTARHGDLSVSDFADDPALVDTCHFLDCDMAILGAEPAAFQAYDRAIAAEYRDVMPAWLFRLRRRKFLKQLLARDRIFLSDAFHRRLDTQARANLCQATGAKR